VTQFRTFASVESHLELHPLRSSPSAASNNLDMSINSSFRWLIMPFPMTSWSIIFYLEQNQSGKPLTSRSKSLQCLPKVNSLFRNGRLITLKCSINSRKKKENPTLWISMRTNPSRPLVSSGTHPRTHSESRLRSLPNPHL